MWEIAGDDVEITQVIIRFWLVGSELQRELEVLAGERRVFLAAETGALVAEIGAQVAVADRAVGLRFERISPQRVRVAPDLDLVPREDRESDEPDDPDRCQRPGHGRPDRAVGRRPRHRPHHAAEQQGQTEAGKVAVAIVCQLVARMNDPDDRGEGDRVVHPDRQPHGPSPPQRHQRHGDRGHGDRRKEKAPVERIHACRELVEWREPLREHRLREVEPETVKYHADPGRRRVPLQRRDEHVDVLGVVRDRRPADSEDHERNLLDPDRTRRGARAGSEAPAQAPQRVDVEQDQDGGQHHDARLRRKGEDVARGRAGEEPAPPPAARVDHLEVRQEGQEEEEPREHVAPLGRPRDRLRPQRMKREEERRGDRRQAQRGPAECRRLLENAERHEVEDRGIRAVDEEARQMVARRVHAPEDVVEAEREPRQRDVMAHQDGREEVPELRLPETAVLQVVGEVDLVVPLDEFVEQCRKEDDEGDQGEGARDRPNAHGAAHQPAQRRHQRAHARPRLPRDHDNAVRSHRHSLCLTSRMGPLENASASPLWARRETAESVPDPI